MPTPWLKRIRETGQLTVFNKGGAWVNSVNAAITTFNTLPFSVELVAEKEEKSANVVVILANGPQHYTREGHTVQTDASFKLNQFHGLTITLTDMRLSAIFFAVIFLPGKLPKPAKGQKEVVIVHEFIHACGVLEHETTPDGGIMYDIMVPSNGGMQEGSKQAKPMPPIRVGPQTLSRVESVWLSSQNYAAWLQRPDI
jgi:hypothetical protein